jgi:hypothetical protein
MADEHQHNPNIDNDPEVIAEEKRLHIKMMRLQYYKELARTIGVFFQTFRNEAVSLVSGISVLVIGYFRVRKWFFPEAHVDPMLITVQREAVHNIVANSDSPLLDPQNYGLLLSAVLFAWAVFSLWKKNKGDKS